MAAAGGLAAYLQQLRETLQQTDECEPDVDQKELGVEDAAKFREEEDLRCGAVLKGTVEPGSGGGTPQEGDLVFLRYSLSSSEERGEVLWSTCAEHGGSGRPQPFVLGRGRRMLRGMELGVQEMSVGERAMLDIKPPYAFLHKDSGLPLPEGLKRGAAVVADVTLTHWIPGGGVRCLGPEGDIFLRTLTPGQGWESPRPPFEVSLHAHARAASTSGRPEEGESYFQSVNGAPLQGSLGAGQLPPGVEAALCSMQRQQEALVLSPVSQLCGGALLPDPPDAAAVRTAAAAPDYAEVKLQLLDFSQVRDMVGDGQVMKRTLSKGEGEFPMDCPLEDSRVRVHYRVRAQGQQAWLVDSRGGEGQGQAGTGQPLEFDTGMGEVPEALDMSVRLMLRGEVAAVASSWRYAYEGRQDAPEGLPPGSGVEFEVELLGYEKEPHQQAAMGGAERLERGARLKEQGNQLFKQGKTKLARAKYSKALKLVERAFELETDEQVAAASALKASCLLNLARCAEQEHEWGEAVGWCNKAISEDDGYAKAYFRRAVLSSCLGDTEAARSDLAICAALDPSAAPECERELARMERREAAAEAKQRGALKGFFDR